jgi:outer membrane protein OmpA-like peptidoglycan-associated protein
VNFEFNSAKLLPEARPALDKAVQILKDNPAMRVRIEGYTDSVGSDSYNMKLSQERADAVRVYLIEHADIDPQRIQAKGFGETNPVASNDTDEGRAENRRIEFVVVEP